PAAANTGSNFLSSVCGQSCGTSTFCSGPAIWSSNSMGPSLADQEPALDFDLGRRRGLVSDDLKSGRASRGAGLLVLNTKFAAPRRLRDDFTSAVCLRRNLAALRRPVSRCF